MMARLSKYTRDQMARALVRHRFQDRADALSAESTALFNTVLDERYDAATLKLRGLYPLQEGVEMGRGGTRHLIPVLSLVHRESGQCRSFVVDNVGRDELLPIVLRNVERETYIMTDQAGQYKGQFRNLFLGHGVVNHAAGEYGRGRVHTNTVEGSFSIFKRGMKGVYQHCSEKHLHRYVAEFEFRYNNRQALGCNDGERSVAALQNISGKRLTYRSANSPSA